MTALIVKHKVEDYKRWRPHFDQHEQYRKDHGESCYTVYQSPDNPNELFLYFEWDNKEHALEFISSEDLKEKMKEAGVTAPPTYHFLDEGGWQGPSL